ncbi:MAG: sensor domain-containing diguanylate cyclase [Treponema sp.]|jgi:diguanylate cyclase (GGDEF)-like protein|nr:sensor domain-containing diguanylate cyclase [Treponema sp.]
MKNHKRKNPPMPENSGQAEKKGTELADEIYSDPKILEHRSLLEQIGIFSRIDKLNKQIADYHELVTGGLDIINRTSLDAIMDAAVFRISGHFMPSFVTFLWKPIQNRDEITIKSYQNYQPTDLGIKLHSITPFESFFERHPKPVNFSLMAAELEDRNVLNTLEKLKPEIIVPIVGGFGLYGIILMGQKMAGGKFSDGEILFVEQLMAFVTQAIMNYLNYQHSLRDVKTGLYNHGFFIHRLGEEIARTRRGSFTSSIIVMDVDKFKNFNDAFGHMAGDKVLETLAITLKQTVRSEDIPSRFGGEEFTVLLPDTDKEAAWLVSERVRNAVEEMQVPWEPSLPQVTISLGICSFDHREQLSAGSVIQRADAALYVSKQRGRNRSTLWNPGMGHVEG